MTEQDDVHFKGVQETPNKMYWKSLILDLRKGKYSEVAFYARKHSWTAGRGDVDWIGLAQDRNRWRALVNLVLNIRVP
jgi:hypothetical protein